MCFTVGREKKDREEEEERKERERETGKEEKRGEGKRREGRRGREISQLKLSPASVIEKSGSLSEHAHQQGLPPLPKRASSYISGTFPFP